MSILKKSPKAVEPTKTDSWPNMATGGTGVKIHSVEKRHQTYRNTKRFGTQTPPIFTKMDDRKWPNPQKSKLFSMVLSYANFP